MNLKKKSRIYVEKGAVLIGGLDESGEVPEGCIFVQLKDDQTNTYIPLTGPVLVAKHPVTHLGDVRMLLAVDIPILKDHKNVLLFSQHGDRSEANKMSGSDLDGDEYAVTWDERLFLNGWNRCLKIDESTYESISTGRILKASISNHIDVQKANHLPMNFDPQKEAEMVDKVLDKHLIDHFIQFGRSDSLGRISMMWLDYAAMKTADCNECLKLAELHSIAVDYPKSGVPAQIPRELVIKTNVPRPH